MAGKKQKKKTERIVLNVVFDTNLIFGDLGVIPNEVVEIIKESESWDVLEIHWYISDTVYHEGFNKFLEKAPQVIQTYGNASGNIKRYLDIETTWIEEKKDDELKELFDKRLEESRIKILKTKWKSVDTEELMINACRKVKPFTGSEGKGFRDSLIIENLKQNITDISKNGKCQTIFVVRDVLAEIAIEETIDKVEIIDSVEKLISSLKLQKSETDEKFIYKLNDTANEFFRTALLFQNDIPQKILNEHEETFSNPNEPLARAVVNLSPMSPKKKLILRKEANFYTLGTSFKRKYRGETFSWESKIRVQRIYDETVEESPLSNMFVNIQNSIGAVQQPLVDVSNSLNDIYKSATAGVFLGGEQEKVPVVFDNEPIVEREKIPLKYDFEFKVTWNSKVDEEGKITEPKILDISFVRQYSPYYPFITI